MLTRDIIVVGASAGGVTALMEFVQSLPAEFKGSIFVVLHIPPYSKSALPAILTRSGSLPAVHPEDGDKVKPGMIYVAPPDHHLILEKDRVMVKKGPKENRSRPSIDALFRSAAYTYGNRVIGVLLSGVLDDGTSGLWTIKRLGGVVMVQDPEDAEQSQMPLNAMEYVMPDHVLPAYGMGELIVHYQKKTPPERSQLTEKEKELLEMEVIIASKDDSFQMGIMTMGDFTPFTCPECHGAFVQLVEGNLIRYRCHTGHAYTANSLLAEVSQSVEAMLWQSMRGFEEITMLLSKIAEQYQHLNQPKSVAYFKQKADDNSSLARIIHDSIFKLEQYSEDLRPGGTTKSSEARTVK